MLSRTMSSLRFSAGRRACVFVLLGWFALDLGVMDLLSPDCADLIARDAAVGRMANGYSVSNDLRAVPLHFDDCLCCSHAVEMWSAASLAPLPPAPDRIAPALDRVPFPSKTAPYHPPRV